MIRLAPSRPIAPRLIACLASFFVVLAALAVPSPCRRALAAAAPSAPTGAAKLSPNLLANPGFEEGGLFAPADWDTTVAGVPTVLFFWDQEMKHGGERSASIVNAGDILPVWHNWNQIVPDGGRYAGRDLDLTVWTRSAQLSGRGYVMVQCYRDTVLVYAREKNISRDAARKELGFHYADDPQLELGWARQYFSEETSDWTERHVHVYVPPTTDLVLVRCGIYGAGQVWFDDAALTAGPAHPPTPIVLGKNLLANPGFERPLDDWEFSMPPTPGASITTDSTVAHSGRYSVLLTGSQKAAFETFQNACQVFNARNLAGKRVRMSGWCKTEDLTSTSAYLQVYATGLYGVDGSLAGNSVSGTSDWTFYSVEWDVPKNTYTVWARAGYLAAPGKCWWDDLKFEVLGDTPAPVKAAKPKTATRASAAKPKH
jgi:hypothetical protein